jgi:hypothetical protein
MARRATSRRPIEHPRQYPDWDCLGEVAFEADLCLDAQLFALDNNAGRPRRGFPSCGTRREAIRPFSRLDTGREFSQYLQLETEQFLANGRAERN